MERRSTLLCRLRVEVLRFQRAVGGGEIEKSPTIEFRAMLRQVAATPFAVARLLDGLDATRLREKPSPEEFSMIEQICHLRDLELEGFCVRFRKMLFEDNPSLPDFDGARVAAERDYNREHSDVALESFADARRLNVELLSNIESDSELRSGKLEGVGRVTIGQLVERMLEHDNTHLEELASLRHRLLRIEED